MQCNYAQDDWTDKPSFASAYDLLLERIQVEPGRVIEGAIEWEDHDWGEIPPMWRTDLYSQVLTDDDVSADLPVGETIPVSRGRIMTHSKTSALISRQTLRGGAALDSFEGAWELMMDWIRSAPDAQITECSIEPDWDDLDSEDPWRVSLDVLP